MHVDAPASGIGAKHIHVSQKYTCVSTDLYMVLGRANFVQNDVRKATIVPHTENSISMS
jgi:hypothetical protein